MREIDKNNPHSLALFDRKIRSLCREVKDKTLSKYFLENFIRKLNELTPNVNFKKRIFSEVKRNINPLQKTKEVYKIRSKFGEKELKEFSVLFLVMNNLDVFRKNIELFSELNFSKDLMSELKQKLIDYLLDKKFFDKKSINIDDFDGKFKNILIQINENAPVKIIYKNKKDSEILTMFSEIIKEIDKIDLRKKIEFLEDKVSSNLDENLYSELLTLRNQLKRG